MKTKHINILAALLMTSAWAGIAAEPAANAGADRENDDTADAWRVQVGWVHQWGRGMKVSGPPLMIDAGGRRAASGSLKLKYADNDALIPREFDDGYVGPDLWTSDPGVPAERQRQTWNWGVDNAGQYDYDGGVHPTLTFHVNRGERVGSLRTDDSGASDDDLPSDGIEVKGFRRLRSWSREDGTTNALENGGVLNMNLVVGLAWFPQGGSQTHRRGVEQDVYRVSETYTYLDYYGTAAGGSWPALDVPYAGEYGTVGGTSAGPLIPATPESSALHTSAAGTRRNSVTIESEIWRLRGEIGIDLSLPLADRLRIYVDPQFVLEYVDMSIDRTETHTDSRRAQSASYTDSRHKSRLYPGFLLTAGADYRVTENWFAGASAGYEWLFDDPSAHVGPDKVEYDLNGGEISLYVGREF
ncbi:MAG: hypothetical protein GX615_10795 [Lentisphaerae bacterium]|nr:hypothetical protein [Lentisphaerota bacterium]